MKSSTEIARQSGMSHERVTQFARSHGVQKVGMQFVWTEDDEKAFLERIGKRGQRIAPAPEITEP